jgi:hypothetical protein
MIVVYAVLELHLYFSLLVFLTIKGMKGNKQKNAKLVPAQSAFKLFSLKLKFPTLCLSYMLEREREREREKSNIK